MFEDLFILSPQEFLRKNVVIVPEETDVACGYTTKPHNFVFAEREDTPNVFYLKKAAEGADPTTVISAYYLPWLASHATTLTLRAGGASFLFTSHLTNCRFGWFGSAEEPTVTHVAGNDGTGMGASQKRNAMEERPLKPPADDAVVHFPHDHTDPASRGKFITDHPELIGEPLDRRGRRFSMSGPIPSAFPPAERRALAATLPPELKGELEYRGTTVPDVDRRSSTFIYGQRLGPSWNFWGQVVKGDLSQANCVVVPANILKHVSFERDLAELERYLPPAKPVKSTPLLPSKPTTI